jgi:simple sugar transport system permease protein
VNLGGIRIEKRLRQRRWLMVAVPLGSLVVAHIAIAALLLATGHPPVTTLRRLFDAAYLANGALTNTLIASTPLAFTGLAAAVAFRMRLFNIGAEGQLYFGAIGATGMALLLSGQSTPVLIVAMVAGGAVLGAAWGAIPGLLRAFLRTNEIITSLMLNYVAAYLITYLIFESQSYWRETEGFNASVFPTGKQLPPSAVWPSWKLDIQGGVSIPLGLLIGIGIAVALWFLYQRTRFGFEVQVVSDSERAARYGGVRIRRKILAVMGISGAIAGIGGASQVGDFAHSVDGDPNGLQKLGYGYTGIVIAALARYNPFATCLVAFLIGGLENAGNTLQGADFPSGLVGVIQGLILFSALGGELLLRYRVRFGRREVAPA